jgi:hypothetical protein
MADASPFDNVDPATVEAVRRMCERPSWMQRMGAAVVCQPESLPYPEGTEPIRKVAHGDEG